jgi:hypothetical protein
MRISGNREIKLSRDPVLAVAAENWEEMARKGLGCAKQTLYCSVLQL